MQLNFSVKEQTLTFDNPEKKVVEKSQNYLTAKFTFCEEWKEATPKTAIFTAAKGDVFKQPLDDNGGCVVPWEVISYPHFSVSVFGGDLITTNKVAVPVTKSGYGEGGSSSKTPTPDPYKLLVEEMNKKIDEMQNTINKLSEKSLVRTIYIDLLASKWEKDGDRYFQVVSVDDVPPKSKIDLQLTVEQVEIFHEKDIAFVTENYNGVITVYCIGQKPTSDYTVQATITEVTVNG